MTDRAATDPFSKRIPRGRLSRRALAAVLLGLAAFLAFRFFTPTFQETVAEIEGLGGIVVREWQDVPDWMPTWVPDGLRQFFRLEQNVEVSISAVKSREDARAIIRLLPRISHIKRLWIENTGLRDEDLALLASVPEIEHLVVRDVPVRGSFLRSLAGHGKLRNLWLRSEHWDQSLPRGLAELPRSIVNLQLYGNGATDAVIPQLAKLHQLESLALSDTSLTGSTLKQLQSLPRLASLVLYRCPVTDEHVSQLASLSSLNDIGLSQTLITDKGLRELAVLSGLRRLWLDKTMVTGSGFNVPSSFPAVEAIFLQGCPVTDAGLESISHLSNLDHLLLSQTEITDAGLASLSRLPKLQRLDLDGTMVSGAGFNGVVFPQLQFLSLRETAITDKDLMSLSGIPINLLWLEKTRISDAGIDALLAIPSLVFVWLDGTEITDSGRIRLQAARPKLRIESPVSPVPE